MVTPGGPIVLYDGVCALCNGIVRFILARDPRGIFRFAALQGDLARGTLARHGRNPDDLDTFCLVLEPGTPAERILDRSTAAAYVLSQLGGLWTAVAGLLRVVPRGLRDGVYDIVARRRYETFGKYDVCPLPRPEHRARFLD
jgi:predicted DCC family thiol-disulfide oxidoreductase YuxK